MIFGLYYTDFFLYLRMAVLVVLTTAMAYWIWVNRVRVTATKLAVSTPEVSKEEQARILNRYEKRMAPLPTREEAKQLGHVDLQTDEVDLAFDGLEEDEEDPASAEALEDPTTEASVVNFLRGRLSEARTYGTRDDDEDVVDDPTGEDLPAAPLTDEQPAPTPKTPVDSWKKRQLEDPVKLVVRCLDLHHCDILVDGRRLVELRGEREKACLVPRGEVMVELAEPGALTGYVGARIDTGKATEMQIGVSSGEPLAFYNHKGRWTVLEQSKLSAVVVGDEDSLDEESVSDLPSRSSRPTKKEKKARKQQPATPLTEGLPQFPDFPELDAAPATQQVELCVVSEDGEWADVLVEGEVVAELKADKSVTVRIPEGRVLVEARAFMEMRPYARAIVDMRLCGRVTLRLREGKPFQVEGARGVDYQAI